MVKKTVKKSANVYTEKKDKVADKKLIKNLTPKQKAAFNKADDKHRKVKTMAQDKVIDKKIIKQVKKKVK